MKRTIHIFININDDYDDENDDDEELINTSKFIGKKYIEKKKLFLMKKY